MAPVLTRNSRNPFRVRNIGESVDNSMVGYRTNRPLASNQPVEGSALGVRMRRQRDSRSTTNLSKRSRKGQRGQSLVELAFMLPTLLIVVFGIIDFGMGLRSYIALTNATREGARYATVGNTAGTYPTNCDGTTGTTVIGRVCVTVQPLKVADMQSVTVTYPTGQGPGKSVVVAATYRYNFVTPIGAFVRFFTGGTFPAYLTLSASSNMRQE